MIFGPLAPVSREWEMAYLALCDAPAWVRPLPEDLGPVDVLEWVIACWEVELAPFGYSPEQVRKLVLLEADARCWIEEVCRDADTTWAEGCS